MTKTKEQSQADKESKILTILYGDISETEKAQREFFSVAKRKLSLGKTNDAERFLWLCNCLANGSDILNFENLQFENRRRSQIEHSLLKDLYGEYVRIFKKHGLLVEFAGMDEPQFRFSATFQITSK